MELCERYLHHAKTHYRDGKGGHTSELKNMLRVIREIRGLYGRTHVKEFGPLQLKALRVRFIEAGCSRGTCNRYTEMVRRVFRWGVSDGLIPYDVLGALQAVEGLKRGRCEAPETERVRPVPTEDIEAALANLPSPVAALVQLQLLSAARPGELLTLRPKDFDRSGAIWLVTPEEHKTAYQGRERVIYFGSRAQDVLKPFMLRPEGVYLFSPREAERERFAKQSNEGMNKPRRQNQKPNPRKTSRKLGDCYTTDSYRRAIEYACKKAGVPVWTPYRLRHNAATLVRKQFGLEAAQVVLGHAKADVTQIYAEVDKQKALAVIAEIG